MTELAIDELETDIHNLVKELWETWRKSDYKQMKEKANEIKRYMDMVIISAEEELPNVEIEQIDEIGGRKVWKVKEEKENEA